MKYSMLCLAVAFLFVSCGGGGGESLPQNLAGLEGTWDLSTSYTCIISTLSGDVTINGTFPDRIEIRDPYHAYEGTDTELDWSYDGNTLHITDWMDFIEDIDGCGSVMQEVWFELSIPIQPGQKNASVIASEDLILETSGCGDLDCVLDMSGTLVKQ